MKNNVKNENVLINLYSGPLWGGGGGAIPIVNFALTLGRTHLVRYLLNTVEICCDALPALLGEGDIIL